ncbi:hypothetical protein ElyMa_003771100 [Elysia marginata]|uniref:Secreted protein n=1 Tax=Elysia marginata TaxID=1093978 RepID=A0AAV4F9L3_9GAST|nr:hypothetical protein ElyMa_003771100 [Elysia marginata]
MKQTMLSGGIWSHCVTVCSKLAACTVLSALELCVGGRGEGTIRAAHQRKKDVWMALDSSRRRGKSHIKVNFKQEQRWRNQVGVQQTSKDSQDKYFFSSKRPK